MRVGVTSRAAAAVLTSLVAATTLGERAVAGTEDIRRSDNALWLGLGGSFLDYKERVDGQIFNTEDGWHPTLAVGGSFLSPGSLPWWGRNLYVSLQGSASIGESNYTGSLSDGTPLKADTDNEIYKVDGRLGRAFELADGLMLTPFAELGLRYWKRGLNGPGGYDESYRHMEALGGLLLQYSPAPRWVLSLDGAVGRTFYQNIDIEEPFNTDAALGNQYVVRGDVKLGFALTPAIEIFTSAGVTNFEYGRSSVVNSDLGPVLEPKSSTWQTNLLAGIAYRFGT